MMVNAMPSFLLIKISIGDKTVGMVVKKKAKYSVPFLQHFQANYSILLFFLVFFQVAIVSIQQYYNNSINHEVLL